MFGTLLLKEMHETIITGRFTITVLLMVILIPLSFFVSLQEYEQRLSAYQDAVTTYQNESKGNINSSFRALGYRPPSPLSVFVIGTEPLLRNKAETTSISIQLNQRAIDNEIVNVSNGTSLDNPLIALFGKLDFLFIVSTVLSMLAFVFTFACISGEREQGTLKHIIANPVDRWMVLSAKMIGNYILFILPFISACVIGLIILNFSDVFSLSSPGIVASILTIIGISMIFLFCVFTLGVLVSALSKNVVNAFVALLFAWVILALVIPKLSPMAARQLYPIQTRDSFLRQLKAVREDIMAELHMQEKEVFEQLLASHGMTEDEYQRLMMLAMSPDSDYMKIRNEYDELVAPLHEEYAQQIARESDIIRTHYENQCAVQQNIAMQLSRLSPVSCLTYILTAISSTSYDEVERFTHAAEVFQDEFMNTMHEYIDVSWIGNTGMQMEKKSTDDMPVPQMENFTHMSLREAVVKTWPDMFILVLYTILFFAGSFTAFLRYDVR